MRSGAHALTLLAVPLNVLLLRALGDGPGQQAELRRKTGSPAQTTLRAQLKKLTEAGVIERRRHNGFPGALDYELTQPGKDLLLVADILERWLATAPDEPAPLGSGAAKATTKALADAWSSGMLRALAPGPLSLTELDGVIVSLTYPSLDRRLTALRHAGLVRVCNGNGRGRPHAVSGWLRRGTAVLVAAARWERDHLPQPTTIGRIEAETAFLLSVPLLRAPALSGTCKLAINLPGGEGTDLAGVVVGIREGTVTSCSTRLQHDTDAQATGPPDAWLDALSQADMEGLQISGNAQMARAVVTRLSHVLFDSVAQS